MSKETISVEMSADEYAELQKMKQEKAAIVAKQKQLEERENYKNMVSSMVDELFPMLENLAHSLGGGKKRVYDSFTTAIAMKKELYDTKDSQNTHTFTNAKGDRRICVGYSVIDNYDDTVNEGVEKVRQYIKSLSQDEKTEQLVDAILQLLAKDKKGNIKPGKVVALSNIADKSDSELFKDGVRIIKEAYKPIFSKQFVRAEKKLDNGEWVNVPLGMTEA